MSAMIALLTMSAAFAKSWCASPVIAHESGVAELRAEGGLVLPAELPPWFERSGVQPLAGSRVRDLPADSGIRALPIVQFWRGGDRSGPIPLAATVGFTHGTASVWFPPIDTLTLLTPATQLGWDALTLDDAATNPPLAIGSAAWVEQLRGADGALWVNRGGDSERFLFYEGRTAEEPAIVVTEAAGRWTVLNRSPFPVHDIWLVRAGHLGHVATLAPGGQQDLTMDRAVDAAWRDEFRSGWIDPAAPAPSLRPRVGSGEGCVMQRDLAVPVNVASGYALYASEVDTLMGVSGECLFASGDHLIYREDPAALDAIMPVALYTDMLYWVEWRRLGVVLADGPPRWERCPRPYATRGPS